MSAKISRRGFLLLWTALAGPLVCASAGLAAGKPKPGGDNGIGGTGYAPTDNGVGGAGFAPEDRGIGGTGFIGIIRKFGSVYVNGARIVYPADAEILVDGAPAQIADLRLGQSTRIVATPSGKDFETRRIEVVSEAVGRVDRIAGRWVSVLGQNAYLPSASVAKKLKTGDRIAISGLRRPDQTIVATAVERRDGARDQIAGLLTRDGAGALRIGGQTVVGVDPGLAGGRVRVVGAREGEAFVARLAAPDGPAALGAVRKLSIETFVAHQQGAVVTASGLTVQNIGGELRRPQLVVMTGALAADRQFIAEKVFSVGPGGGFEPPHGGGGFPPGGGSGGSFPPGGGPGGGFSPGGAPHGGLPGGGHFGNLPTPGSGLANGGASHFSGAGGVPGSGAVPGAGGAALPVPNLPSGGASSGELFGAGPAGQGFGGGLSGGGALPNGASLPSGVNLPSGASFPSAGGLPNAGGLPSMPTPGGGAIGNGPFGGFFRGR